MIKPVLVIFAGSRDSLDPAHTAKVQHLIQDLSPYFDFVYGGGISGTMGFAASVALNCGAQVHAVCSVRYALGEQFPGVHMHVTLDEYSRLFGLSCGNL